MEITIRRANASDADELGELIRGNAEKTLAPHYTDAQWKVFVTYYSREMMEKKCREQIVFCAEKEQSIVGTIALDGNFVVGFYTRVANLNQGIGSMMMKELESYAKAQGIEELELAASPVGLSFYYKHGWAKVRDIIMEHYGVGFEETLMRKRLSV
jgi:N-acetylglutamate synthase-like GNAT family acetyltransferase